MKKKEPNNRGFRRFLIIAGILAVALVVGILAYDSAPAHYSVDNNTLSVKSMYKANIPLSDATIAYHNDHVTLVQIIYGREAGTVVKGYAMVEGYQYAVYLSLNDITKPYIAITIVDNVYLINDGDEAKTTVLYQSILLEQSNS